MSKVSPDGSQEKTCCDFGDAEEDDEEDVFKDVPLASYSDLIRHATCFDIFCMCSGLIGAATVGAAQPISIIVFGDIIDLAGSASPQQSVVDEIAIKMVCIGVVCFVAAWAGEAGFKTSGLR